VSEENQGALGMGARRQSSQCKHHSQKYQMRTNSAFLTADNSAR